LIRNNYREFSDGLIDLDIDGRIGKYNSCQETLYFSDGFHLTANGYYVIASIIQKSLDDL